VQKPEAQTRDWYASETLLTLAFCTVCAVVLAFLRGMWLDEAWTIWFTYPGLPLAVAQDRWLHDAAHPHLYLFLEWLLSSITGTSVTARRLTHLPLLLFMAIPTMLIVRRNTPRAYLGLVAIAFATNPFFIVYFAEHRAYNLGMTSVGCVTLVVRFLHLEAAANRRVRWPAYAWLFVSTLVALNIHYTIALTALALIGSGVLMQFKLRQFRLGLILSATALAALIPVLVQLFLALRVGPAEPPDVFGFGLLKGELHIFGMIGVGLLANPALTWLAARRGLDELRGIDSAPPLQPGIRSFAMILIGTLVVCVLGFTVMQLITRSVMSRLLIGLVALAIILVVELASWRFITRAQFRLICLSGAALVLATTLYQANNPRWEYHVPRIKRMIAQCPTTRVLAMPLRRLENGIGEQEAQVHPFVYRLLARQNGFAVEIVPQRTPLSIRGISCPVLLWREHYFMRPSRTAAEWLTAAHVEADPRQIAATRVINHDFDSLVIVPPLAEVAD